MILFLKLVQTWTNNNTVTSWTTNTIRQKQHTRTSMTATCRYKWEVLPNNGMCIKKKKKKSGIKLDLILGALLSHSFHKHEVSTKHCSLQEVIVHILQKRQQRQNLDVYTFFQYIWVDSVRVHALWSYVVCSLVSILHGMLKALFWSWFIFVISKVKNASYQQFTKISWFSYPVQSCIGKINVVLSCIFLKLGF